ncbi:hypothetical protein BDQ12DRAFT_679655 [Crucibulum laeve]|uniref:Metallo-dependent hydrolase n=1 Tax=Crucibulum laeve TaxID=68775 RepID=A0A5C3MHC3_9AGAR|nr:hypothetical protein BDQ12DRAFT_679655 [Crucibulum laeve]
MDNSNSSAGSLVIVNVRLPYADQEKAAQRWMVECLDGLITKITSFQPEESLANPPWTSVDANGSLMLPSLCHSHIHLDKCFILDRCGELVNGDFSEAMRVTNEAKANFALDTDDLYGRGNRLIRESIENGVTAMRAHVEVDTTVKFTCLDVGLALQAKYQPVSDIQVAVFAQEPLFVASGDTTPGPNFYLLEEAIKREGVTVVGSAPYVEATVELAKRNIALIFEIARLQSIELIDFHLDYNLDPTSEPLIYEVITQMKCCYENPVTVYRPRISIGHATRLQLFTPEEWQGLVNSIGDLPITFISLPQSDIYMQGRAEKDTTLGPPRGTLRVPYLARKYGLQVAMSVNNVENAFTPQGSLDPLSLCTFGAAIFQAVIPEDLRALTRSVTLTSKLAMGMKETPVDLVPSVGNPADFVIIHGNYTLQSAVLNPGYERTTIRAGSVVATRRCMTTLFIR